MASRQPGDILEVAADGTVAVEGFQLPPSAALSPETRARWAGMLSMVTASKTSQPFSIPDPRRFQTEAAFRFAVDEFRRALDDNLARPAAAALLASFPVNITPARMGGVPVEVFTPLEGEAVRGRQLFLGHRHRQTSPRRHHVRDV